MPKRLHENLWFNKYQGSLLWLANTDLGRDLLCIDKRFPLITEMGKNFVRAEYEPGKYITDFRVGAKWSNVIRYRWKDFCNYMTYAPGIQYTLALDKVPVIGSGLRGATTTVYPDPDPETTTVDGYIQNFTSTSWDTVHDATSGTAGDSNGALFIESGKLGAAEILIRRSIVLFDTSSITDTDTIDAVTLDVYPTDLPNGDNDGDDFIAVVTSTPASNTAVANGDYDQVGDAVDNPTEQHDVGERKDLTSMSTGAYTAFTFNATGRGNIDKTGVSKFGLREGHDIIDSPYAGANSSRNRLQCSSADNAGTSQDPKLTVTHSAGGATFTPKSIFI